MRLLLPAALTATFVATQTKPLAWMLEAWLRTGGAVHMVLAVLLVALAYRSSAGRFRLDAPTSNLAPWAVAVGGPLAAAALHRFAPINAILAAGTLVGAYGLVGIFLSQETWRNARTGALLALAVLPITEHLDVLLGFPLRALTAQAVAAVLGSELNAATVLQIEGGVAHIDLACAGVKSLWSAAVVLLAAATLWGHRPSPRWVAIFGLAALQLMVANAARVLVIVALCQAQLPLLADIVHTPLGVMGFAAGVGPALLLLHATQPSLSASPLPHTPASGWRVPALAAGWALAALLVAIQPQPSAPTASMAVPETFDLLPMNDEERAFSAQQGSRIAKARFHDELAGTVIWVHATSWLAHHVPEQCHRAAGWQISGDHLAQVGEGNRHVRWATAERDGKQASVLWWFQARDGWTDDHTERIASAFVDPKPWVMVSVLLERPTTPDDPAVADLVAQLAATAATSLEAP